MTGSKTLNRKKLLAAIAAAIGIAAGASARTIDLSSVPEGWGNEKISLKYSDSNITLTGTLCRDTGFSLAAGKTLTLSNATIKSTSPYVAYANKNLKWAGLTCEGDATIILVGDNYVEGFYRDYPGIYIPEGSTLTIKGEGTLTAHSSGFEGDGTSHGYAAGIGGGWADDVKYAGNIVIESGTVTAIGGFGGAGIGAGPKGRCGNVTITGGKVVATGGMMQGTTEEGAWHPEEQIYGGVGIGAGWRGLCHDVTINGGTVVAVGNQPAAGIGSSREGYCNDITITGGRVSAEGGYYGPGIGAGVNGQCADITIGSGIISLTAIRGPIYEVDTIGKGDGGICGDVTIAPEIAADMTYGRMRFLKMVDLSTLVGNVTVADGMTMTGRLKGNYKVSIAADARVELRAAMINGVNDVAYSWAGLTCLGNATIYLGDVNTVRGFHQNYPGIYVPKGSELKIRTLGWGSLTARSNGKAAGIGAGIASDVATCGDIDIGGNVHITAVGGANAAGIGSAEDSGDCGVINIGTVQPLRGSVTATCGAGASKPIGAGKGGSPITVARASGLIDTTSGSTRKILPSEGNLATLTADKTFEDGAILTGTLAGNYKISIADGATVTISDVSINGVNNSSYAWAGITCLGDATIILDGTNTVRGFYERCPGIYVPEGKTLTIKGEGSLDASSNGDRAAGIGGGWYSCGNIVIEGGTIVATGGSFARGIGGGSEEACGSIRIGSGITSVTAFPGIGAGYNGTGGDVEIGDYIDTEVRSAGTTIYTTADLSRLTGDKTFHHGTTITGTLAGHYKISIAHNASVTLEDVTINGENVGAFSWAGITCEGYAIIHLSGKNYICGFEKSYPGLYIPEGGGVQIDGSGSLVAESNGRGAGIGGGYNLACGNIAIFKATVVATGGDNAAGIGGGYGSSCGHISIGTHVKATGGLNAPGIGAGSFGSCGNIRITGGTVEAKGDGYGAGIGTGQGGVSCGDIIIGGSITRVIATCGNDIDTQIGKGGYSGSCEVGEISIAYNLDDTTVGKTRTLQPRDLSLVKEDRTLTDGATITGTLGANVKISIADGATVTLRDVTIEGVDDLTYAWAGLTCLGDATIILEGENTVKGFYYEYPGISVPPGRSLTIKGDGSLDASSNGNGAGIGGGFGNPCGNIVIEGGKIIATGGDGAAGIGGGEGANCGNISIWGGTVMATGGNYAPGIGGGASGACGTITIGTDVTLVMAVKGEGAPYSVGAGYGGSDVDVTVGGETGMREENPFMYPMTYLTAGTYFKKTTLAELGFNVPTDGTAYSVKALGLPAGLKLKYNAAVKNKKGKVTTKAKSTWWIEGVPTAATDYLTNPPYLVITANGKTETVPLMMQVAAQAVKDLGELALGESVTKTATDWLTGIAATGWTVTGLPTGLKYTAKAIKKPKVAANTVYGKTTKAGLFTVTAKKKVSGFYETKKYTVLVRPKAVTGDALFGTMSDKLSYAYMDENWNLKADVSAQGGNVVKVTGLPKGLSFAAANTYYDKKKTKLKQQGQTIVGAPTKPGTYVVTFTKNVKSGKKTVAKTAQILWEVRANGSTPTLAFNTSGGEVAECTIGLKYTGDLLAFTANATKVTASGLPKGISVKDLGGGNWGFQGYTTKAGTYLVTVNATVNGNTVTQRIALKANGLPGWAKGTFNGAVISAEDGVTIEGLATMTVSSVGKISGKFQQDGKTWTFSAACYTEYADGIYSAPVTAKYTYKVKEKVKGKTKTVTKTETRTFSLSVADTPLGIGEAFAYCVDNGTRILAYQNLWKSTYKAVGKKLFYTSKKKQYKTFTRTIEVDGQNCTLSLKITVAGAVKATLTYNTGKKKKGKVVYYKPTCSTVVVPVTAPDADPFGGDINLYFAPSSANNFVGLGVTVPL